MYLTRDEIEAWIPVFQAFLSDDCDILTSMKMMYPREQVEENDVDEVYVGGDDDSEYATRKSDWHPIDKKCGLEIVRFNRTVVDPRYYYRVVKKEEK